MTWLPWPLCHDYPLVRKWVCLRYLYMLMAFYFNIYTYGMPTYRLRRTSSLQDTDLSFDLWLPTPHLSIKSLGLVNICGMGSLMIKVDARGPWLHDSTTPVRQNRNGTIVLNFRRANVNRNGEMEMETILDIRILGMWPKVVYFLLLSRMSCIFPLPSNRLKKIQKDLPRNRLLVTLHIRL